MASSRRPTTELAEFRCEVCGEPLDEVLVDETLEELREFLPEDVTFVCPGCQSEEAPTAE